MIDIKDVSVQFETSDGKVDAVKDVTLSIKEGEVYGVIGYSGAGKSTLVRTINMLQVPTSGQVMVNGNDMTRLPEKELLRACKKIGMIFQHFNLMKQRTVAENIAFPLYKSGLSKSEINQRVNRLLELVDLTDRKNSYPAQLSGGQKQRVGIARALANDPKVLLCDEATSALDPNTTLQILDLLKKVNEELGITIVIITHEMPVIKSMCDRVAIMSDGKVVEQGTIFDIFTDPKDPITQSFIESASQKEKEIQDIADEVKEKYGSEKAHLIRIDYAGHHKGDRLVANLVKDYQLTLNILYADVEMIQGQPSGTLLLEVEGEAASIEAALKRLRTDPVTVKEY
ncbi:MAG: ATP-binding cassette domain-containing protein [Atopococcus tabaci]|uniref:ATP-binding cassette domain-containing protein n=1 Tax=Atopococcus tabaci TaxID=269774 RepID=A0AA43ZT30_9LACT|nr:ATP-binding cassette domain-containing protein [Atopococcus tabaci]